MLRESSAVVAGRYRLERRLAAGQVGEVWVATDTELARRVAIKILHVAFKDDAEVREQFKAKSCRAASVEHENLARILDYGEPDSPECPNGPFLVMELVDGPSVADLLSAGPLGAARAMDTVAQVAAALDVAHRAAIVQGGSQSPVPTPSATSNAPSPTATPTGSPPPSPSPPPVSPTPPANGLPLHDLGTEGN